VLQLVVGLFQFMEASSPYGAGAQQREPAFGFSTPAHEMVSPFWDVAECREKEKKRKVYAFQRS